MITIINDDERVLKIPNYLKEKYEDLLPRLESIDLE
jgi:hypothetical protein